MAKKQLGIFFIDVNKAYFYSSHNTAIHQADIPADTMSYFDVVNKDKFFQIVQTLIATNKITPVPLLILFSPSATYEYDSEGKSPEEIATNTQQFLDIVPYERVLSRTYKIQDKMKVIAVNKDMYEVVKHSFEKANFSIVSVASLSLLQKVMPDIGPTLNLEVIASKFESIKQYSLITLEEINNPTRGGQDQPETTKPNPLRLIGLVSVFVVLIGILIFMVFQTMQPPKKPNPVILPAPTIIVLTPTPLVSPTPTVTPRITGVKQGGSLLVPTTSPTPQVLITETPR